MLLILEREFRRLTGVAVTTTSEYAEVLALVSSEQIDLVISDVRIGRDSGFDLAREIKNSHPDVGIILMSAYRSPGNRQQAADLGVITFLEKPFLPRKLMDAVEKFFQQREQPASEPAPTSVQVATEDSSALAHFRLQDLVQLFCLNGKNVLITVVPETNAAAGEIYIQRGRVIHADFAGKTGDDAFHAMMQIGRPLLKVNDWAAPVPVTISTGWELLLLSSAIRVDEQDTRNDLPNRRAAAP